MPNLQSRSYLSSDPALVVLYKQLRDKTLQTLKGASKITPRAEWEFVIQNARLYDRMGCDLLALDLGTSYSPPPSLSLSLSKHLISLFTLPEPLANFFCHSTQCGIGNSISNRENNPRRRTTKTKKHPIRASFSGGEAVSWSMICRAPSRRRARRSSALASNRLRNRCLRSRRRIACWIVLGFDGNGRGFFLCKGKVHSTVGVGFGM